MSDTISKNRTADTGKYTYKYVDIVQIHEYLKNIGVSYYQYVDRLDGDDYIMTVKIIDGVEQKPLRGARIVDATLVGNSNPAQQQGSAITYARRYSLLMAFGLATEDDDAQALSVASTTTQKRGACATPKQVAVLKQHYKDANLEKLLQVNNITKIEDMPYEKAYELIGKLGGK